MNGDYAELVGMMKLLMDDVHRSGEALAAHDAKEEWGYWARTHTRSVFAAIEGSCEYFRQQAFVAELNKFPNRVSLGKLSVLAGETYFVTDDGEIRAQDLRVRFLAHVLLSLNSYAEAQGASHRVKKGENWHRVRSAVEARHRVTHPKNYDSLKLDQAEIEHVDFTLKWFLNEVAIILREKGADLPAIP
jgi:hypothetical protein